LLGERAQIARTGGKVDRGHQKGSPGPRKLTVSAYKCKMAAEPKDIAVIASQWVGATGSRECAPDDRRRAAR
jgi:hypothetical protein